MCAKQIKIRKATIGDAEKIAIVHLKSWQTTYKGIIANDFLQNLNLDQRIERWKNVLSQKPINTFVAENDNIVGFSSAGKARDQNDYDGELYAIYLLEDFQHQHIGKKLLLASINFLLEINFHSMYVWVLEDNPSRRFYQKIGGKLFDKKEIVIAGQTLTEVAYGWNDLTKMQNLLSKNIKQL